MNKILSVIVPTYNMEQLLPRCLNSIIKTNNCHIVEVLIINDGSKDNSLQIAKSFENKFPNIIRVIDKENGNYGSVINRGIVEATGKYLRILDADDYFDTKELEKLLINLMECDVDLVVTNFTRCELNYKSKIEFKNYKTNEIFDFSNFEIAKSDSYRNFVMHSMIYKTSILKDNNIQMQTGISYTDTEFCFYPLEYIKTFCFVNCNPYQYQIGREGQTISIDAQMRSIGHMEKIIFRMIDFFNKKSLDYKQSIYGKNQFYIMSLILDMYYRIVLCYSNNIHPDSLVRFTHIDNWIKQNNYLLEQINKNGVIGCVHYIKRWNSSKKYSNNRLFKAYYSFIINSKFFLKRILGLISL